jgi:putative SOS response-associated peptidase YedK
LFGYDDRPEFPPRAHVAPNQPIAIVRIEERHRRFALVRWGFVPSWAREIKPGKPLIIARGETALEKPTFRNAMRRRRCLIPADGFYDWPGDVPGRKIPYFVHRLDEALFAFAGLWEHWMGADGSEIETGVILTTAANRELSEIQDRMPVIIGPMDFETWLTGEVDAAAKLMRPSDDGTFMLEPKAISRSSPPSRSGPATPETTAPSQLSLL